MTPDEADALADKIAERVKLAAVATIGREIGDVLTGGYRSTYSLYGVSNPNVVLLEVTPREGELELAFTVNHYRRHVVHLAYEAAAA